MGWHSLRRKFVNDLKPDTPMADMCYLGGWKSALTVMTVYQQPDAATMRTALATGSNVGWRRSSESTGAIDSRACVNTFRHARATRASSS